MKGTIYCNQKCHKCGQSMKYLEGRGVMICLAHPKVTWQGSCRVRFGRDHTKRFKTVLDAERHLAFIRVQTDRGEFDQREWAKNQPLSFYSLRKKFVSIKEKQDLSGHQIRLIKRVLKRAGEAWDYMQIKDIGEGEIDDFLNDDHGLASKTIANWKSVLHNFWKWIVRRERRKSGLQMPEFPEITFKMKMRTLVSITDQQDILDELKRITWEINPRIWLGVKLLSIYPRVRPGEMLNVKEGHINLNDGWMVFPQPKEREPKFIHLLPEVCDMIQEVKNMAPPAMPEVYFFRHIKSRSGVKAGAQFGPKYFNKFWKKAAKNLGIEGVPVYPGTKHSTTTGLGKIMSTEQIKHNVTGHTSNAFKRYYLPDHTNAMEATRQVMQFQGDQHLTNISEGIKKVK